MSGYAKRPPVRYSLTGGRMFPDPSGSWMFAEDVMTKAEAAADANLRLAEEHARVCRERDELRAQLATVAEEVASDVKAACSMALLWQGHADAMRVVDEVDPSTIVDAALNRHDSSLLLTEASQ